ncbi:hypothetical protein Cadr_000001642 [Camelus dromedarius]|uniref:Uncharacterized protein n=1 Tax=Camelus dromedarius TaxID=9838 RepID=A0A5N4EER9_CAMDR|nr:hypothetical protein Cadr_000001642 [Camelus dromedarius]
MSYAYLHPPMCPTQSHYLTSYPCHFPLCHQSTPPHTPAVTV